MRKMFAYGTVTFAVMLSAISGCSPKVQMKEIEPYQGMQQSDVEKVKGYLEAAGVKGNVVSAQDFSETQWVALVTAATEPGKRALPAPPARYLVEKATGKVTPQTMARQSP